MAIRPVKMCDFAECFTAVRDDTEPCQICDRDYCYKHEGSNTDTISSTKPGTQYTAGMHYAIFYLRTCKSCKERISNLRFKPDEEDTKAFTAMHDKLLAGLRSQCTVEALQKKKSTSG